MLVALTLLALALAMALVNRTLVNPITITLGLLAISSALASLQLFGLYDFDPIAYRIVALGGVSVFLGAILSLATGVGRRDRVPVEAAEGELIRFDRLNVALTIAATIILLSRLPQLQILLGGGSLSDVRNSYLGYGGAEPVVNLVDRLFIGPLITVSLPIFLWCLLRRRTARKFLLGFAFVSLLHQVTSGGRFIFLYAGVMVLALLAQSGSLQIRTGRARWIALALGAALAGFTVARGNALLFEAYTYFAIPMPLLAHWSSYAESMDSHTWGAGFVYGALTLLFNLADMLGITLGASVTTAVALPQDHWVELLPNRHFNAFVTLFYYFFLDFRWIGVVAGGSVWGLLGQRAFTRMWNSGPRATFYGLLMFQLAVMSFVRWELTNGSFVIALLILPFFVKSSRGAVNATSKRKPGQGRVPVPAGKGVSGPWVG